MRTLVAIASLLASAAAVAQPMSLPGATRVDDARLAQVRGGFTSPDTGLSVSFGIERSVQVDPATVARAAAASGITLVQRGSGNSFDVGALNNATATVVQNSLDNQKIQTVTTIDVRANSLQTWNGMNLRSSVTNAITASLRR